MHYSIEEAAEGLMLSPEDLWDVFEAFFEEAQESLVECEQAISKVDSSALKRLFHDIKGSASNLLMNDIAKITKSLEDEAEKGDIQKIQKGYPALVNALEIRKERVRQYYEGKENGA